MNEKRARFFFIFEKTSNRSPEKFAELWQCSVPGAISQFGRSYNIRIIIWCVLLDGLEVPLHECTVLKSRVGNPVVLYKGYRFVTTQKLNMTGTAVYCTSRCSKNCKARGVLIYERKILYLKNPYHTHDPRQVEFWLKCVRSSFKNYVPYLGANLETIMDYGLTFSTGMRHLKNQIQHKKVRTVFRCMVSISLWT